MKNIDDYRPLIDRYITELLDGASAEYPLWNQEKLQDKANASWNYIDGCMMTAFMQLYEKTEDRRYLDFCDQFISYFVQDDGSIPLYDENEYNLDSIKEGSVLYKLYDHTGKERFRRGMDVLYSQIQNQPRTKEGNFWHKKIYPHQIWLDGLYMAQPFYLEYEKRYRAKSGYADILSQFRIVVEKMRDPKTGLYYHAYDSRKEQFWCDPTTGLSKNFWLRALGWYSMAMVDCIELLDLSQDGEIRVLLSRSFQDLMKSLIRFQDESGLWYQVVDQGHREGNYLETSGSAIMAYAILKAVRLGLLPEEMKAFGEKAFLGICRTYLKEDADGRMNLGGTCLMAGLGGGQRRDGSFEYYMSEPVVENEAKGIAPFLLAYVELIN